MKQQLCISRGWKKIKLKCKNEKDKVAAMHKLRLRKKNNMQRIETKQQLKMEKKNLKCKNKRDEAAALQKLSMEKIKIKKFKQERRCSNCAQAISGTKEKKIQTRGTM